MTNGKMQFRKTVELPAGTAEVRHPDRPMLMGSCFTEDIGQMFAAGGFRTLVNPFGILYNPTSIAAALERMCRGEAFGEEELVHHGGLWSSLMHHGSFSAADKDECLRRINGSFSIGSKALLEADWLILTFGTAYVYEWKETGRVVGNCHKLPDNLFSRRLLTVAEIAEEYSRLLRLIRERNAKLKVMFTVSPIRHTRDGAHGNQLSKSTLLLAVDEIIAAAADCHYFPSYEIVMDELRDYRFYAADMVHPSPVAVQYIWECFSKTYFRQPTLEAMREYEAVRRGLEHRPLNPDTDEYRQFRERLEEKIGRLREKYPYIEVTGVNRPYRGGIRW